MMKRRGHFTACRIVAVIATGLLASAGCANAAGKERVVLVGATVIDVINGGTSRNDITLQDGRIAGMEPASAGRKHAGVQMGRKDIVIDAAGKYVIPGLWDMHVHMNYLVSLPDDWMVPLFIANGVTSVRDMGGELDRILALREELSAPGVFAPRLWVGGFMDGSPRVFGGGDDEFIKQFPVMPDEPVDTPEEAVALVDKLAAAGVDFIKPYEMLRPEVFSAIAERAGHHGLLVDGHIPQRMTAREAIAEGIDGIVHMKWADYGCARDPEALRAERVTLLEEADEEENGAWLWERVKGISIAKARKAHDPSQCEELVQTIAKQGIWQTPGISTEVFLSGMLGESFEYEALDYVPDIAKTAKHMQYELLRPGGRFSGYLESVTAELAYKRTLIASMHEAGVLFLAGTDSPALLLPGFSLHAELEALVGAGLPPLSALQAATINPARFFNVEGEQGSIRVGNVADLVLLNANPLEDIRNTRKIEMVFMRGRRFDRNALDELRDTYRN